MVEIAPHDLLKIRTVQDLSSLQLPDWAEKVFSKSLTVVVRRAQIADDLIPVGIRGHERSQRLASWVSLDKVVKSITPYELVQNNAWLDLSNARKELPAVMTLEKIAPILSDFTWGISGSVGFELATKTPSAKMTSDLDLVWKPKQRINQKSAQQLLKILNQFEVHADLQVIQGTDGFSLEEYANANSTTMVKTIKGPKLVTDPWEI